MTAAECLEYATEAMSWARRSKTEGDRQALLEIAQTWLQAAALRASNEKGESPATPP